MNLPNICTLSRIPLMFVIVALLYTDWVGAATTTFVLFVIAGLTDFLDGHLARKLGQVSNFGILMDAVTDKVLLLGIMFALVDCDRIPLTDPLPLFLVLIVLGREFMITGMRLVAATKGVVVSADRGGKQKTVTQIIAVGAFLLADVVRLDLAHWIAVDWSVVSRVFEYAGLAVFLLAVVFTISSGVRYFRKYGAVVFAS
ncbi:CDP-diacylglycerol--glycerol-3-phosphate 3-phosphatidyltransferase [Opitutales bacterium ASA1]|uniref:CDP-diacylglycerol--glycerol-3-phosphate 3-phosphatidyltransferase n=1 Tax=Congregicoccus parvus TaxID=3081749 RepID=UPI002B3108AF|nr:CDP-diacylglycerol--glycerol-3-phosphate 3-phosphatidyltransferase [Opitutales bacterium ASA1]